MTVCRVHSADLALGCLALETHALHEALHPFVVDCPAGPLQVSRDVPIAVGGSLLGQVSDSRTQLSVTVIAPALRVPLKTPSTI